MLIQPQLADAPGGVFFLTGSHNDEDAIEGLPLLGADGHTLARGLRASDLVTTDQLPGSYLSAKRREVARLVWERKAHSFSAVDDGQTADGLRGLCADARDREQGLKDGSIPEGLAGLPALGRMGYAVAREWLEIAARIRAELLRTRPNIIVCLGDLPLWLLTGQTSTDEWRGAVRLVSLSALIMRGATEAERAALAGIKLLPTFHPSRIHQEYRRMVPFVSDLEQVKAESAYPEIRQFGVELWLEPTLEDLDIFWEQHIAGADLLTIDIETAKGQMTCFQVGTSTTVALALPFVDYRKPSRSYWPSLAAELAALAWVERVLSSPIPKLMQNGTYDCTYLMDRYDLEVRAYRHDLRLAQHILSPEEPKSLAYMGSMYTQMNAWKAGENKGHGHQPQTERRDD
jgi:hypothetical protein